MSNAQQIKQWRPADMADQTGKVVVITGANSGLGFETAKELVKKGARLIMLCRDPQKSQQAMRQLRELHPTAQIDLVLMDLASFASIKAGAEQVLALTSKIDVLINNAGIMMIPNRTLTQDGLETQMGVNHVGHFLLTQRLFAAVERASGRVVVLGSLAHKASVKGIHIANLNSDHSYHSFLTYSQTKLANVQFGLALARKVQNSRKPVQVYVVHPGYAKTNLQSTGPSKIMNFLMTFSDLVAQSANKGAWPEMMAATTDLFRHGGYYGPTFLDLAGPDGECTTTRHAQSQQQQDALWKKSEEIIGEPFVV